MSKLVIVFVKNILLGKVKTRLAVSIGDQGAFEVYKELVKHTESITANLVNCDLRVYFSDAIIDTKWEGKEKFVQFGDNLGERMRNAFDKAFEDGYSHVLGIGSDLPNLSKDHLFAGFEALQENEVVFGPAEDGGYYLLGMKKIHNEIFDNKPWSQENLLELTLSELKKNNCSFALLETLNDIDTLEDLKKSNLNEKFKHLYELS